MPLARQKFPLPRRPRSLREKGGERQLRFCEFRLAWSDDPVQFSSWTVLPVQVSSRQFDIEKLSPAQSVCANLDWTVRRDTEVVLVGGFRFFGLGLRSSIFNLASTSLASQAATEVVQAPLENDEEWIVGNLTPPPSLME